MWCDYGLFIWQAHILSFLKMYMFIILFLVVYLLQFIFKWAKTAHRQEPRASFCGVLNELSFYPEMNYPGHFTIIPSVNNNVITPTVNEHWHSPNCSNQYNQTNLSMSYTDNMQSNHIINTHTDNSLDISFTIADTNILGEYSNNIERLLATVWTDVFNV